MQQVFNRCSTVFNRAVEAKRTERVWIQSVCDTFGVDVLGNWWLGHGDLHVWDAYMVQ